MSGMHLHTSSTIVEAATRQGCDVFVSMNRTSRSPLPNVTANAVCSISSVSHLLCLPLPVFRCDNPEPPHEPRGTGSSMEWM